MGIRWRSKQVFANLSAKMWQLCKEFLAYRHQENTIAPALLTAFCLLGTEAEPGFAAQPVGTRTGPVTFNRDIAPLLFRHCAYCHRPSQSAPFNLLTYDDARKHGPDLADVTRRRFMPPWLPEPGYARYADERRLSPDEIERIQRWVTHGMPEGAPADLPPPPRWTEGWQLGKPDLIVRLPAPYTLAAESKDVYRNFVVPIPVTSTQYINAVEFQPGTTRTIHHAALRLDRTRQSWKLAQKQEPPGFDGMNMPESTEVPAGHFLNWQPGKLPYRSPDTLAWTLTPATDLVLQLHLRPSGKPERVEPAVGFYFSQRPPTQRGYKLILDSTMIDIPAGATNYKIADRYTLPIDVEVLAVFPHAHYLAKTMQAYATLPNQKREWLLFIKQWDFNWQGDYRFAQPVSLPKGTQLTMELTYDNSAANPANPHQPPQRVRFGAQSSDEMGELWLQVLPRTDSDWSLLNRHHTQAQIVKTVDQNQFWLRSKPADTKIRLQLGKALLGLNRPAEAVEHFRKGTELAPDSEEFHYFVGVTCRLLSRPSEAKDAFNAVLKLNPSHGKAHGNLGFILAEEGQLGAAEAHLRLALETNPDDALARDILSQIQKAKPQR
jgi:hypothetical protein